MLYLLTFRTLVAPLHMSLKICSCHWISSHRAKEKGWLESTDCLTWNHGQESANENNMHWSRANFMRRPTNIRDQDPNWYWKILHDCFIIRMIDNIFFWFAWLFSKLQNAWSPATWSGPSDPESLTGWSLSSHLTVLFHWSRFKLLVPFRYGLHAKTLTLHSVQCATMQMYWSS